MADLAYNLTIIGLMIVMAYFLTMSPAPDNINNISEMQTASAEDQLETLRALRGRPSSSKTLLKEELQVKAVEIADKERSEAWERILKMPEEFRLLEEKSSDLSDGIGARLEQNSMDSMEISSVSQGLLEIIQNLENSINEGKSNYDWILNEMANLRDKAQGVREKNDEVRKWFNIK